MHQCSTHTLLVHRPSRSPCAHTMQPLFHPTAALVKQLEREQEARRNARANAPPGAAVIQFERGHGSAGVLPASRSATDLHAAAAPGPAGFSTVGASLINVAALREQVAKNAAALAAAGVSGRKSKWDNR